MKVFVVHASYGEGHKRAAQALDGVMDAKVIDLLDFFPGSKNIHPALTWI